MEALARYESLVPDFDGFLEALRRPLPTTVRVNSIKADPDRVVEALEGEGLTVTRREWNPELLEVDTSKPGNTWPYVHGWIHGQEEVSTVPPLVVDPDPGDVVWAAAAAPGGKATQLAALMEDTGLVIANDDNLGRLSALRANADRLGVTSMAVTNQDARNYSLKPLGIEAVDHALVDAPCTCEGTVRKSPDALDDAGIGASKGLAQIQADILTRAVQATRPGGTVVYSTCTFAPEENEAVVNGVVAETESEVVEFDVGLAHEPGIEEWENRQFDTSMGKTKRFYPHQNDTGGFYVAKLEVTG